MFFSFASHYLILCFPSRISDSSFFIIPLTDYPNDLSNLSGLFLQIQTKRCKMHVGLFMYACIFQDSSLQRFFQNWLHAEQGQRTAVMIYQTLKKKNC